MGDQGGELVSLGAGAGAQVVQAGEVALGLFHRPLFEQGRALARDRREVARIALQRLAIVVQRLALEALAAGRLGKAEGDFG